MQRVEEAVAATPGRRAGEPLRRHCRAAAAGGRATAVETGRGGTAALQKCVDLLAALAPEDRAGGVQQPPARARAAATARPASPPGSGPARRCRRPGAASARRGGGARCPRRCRARPAGSRRTAGRPTSAPVARASPALQLGLQLQPGQRLLHARQAHRVAVQRQHVEVGELQQVGRLAAGRGAGVEHARAGRQAGPTQQAARRAGRRRPAPRPRLRRSRAAASPARLRRARPPGRRAPGRRRRSPPARARQPLHVGGAGAAARVDAQAHRRVLVARRQQRLPLRRPVVADALDPPQRMVEGADRLVARRLDERVALAHEAAQHGVDEAGAPPACAGAPPRRPGRPACGPDTAARRRATAARAPSAAAPRPPAAAPARRRSARTSVAPPSQRRTRKASAWVPAAHRRARGQHVGERAAAAHRLHGVGRQVGRPKNRPSTR